MYANTILDSRKPIARGNLKTEVDYEVELGSVTGCRARNLTDEAGYMNVNDVIARGIWGRPMDGRQVAWRLCADRSVDQPAELIDDARRLALLQTIAWSC